MELDPADSLPMSLERGEGRVLIQTPQVDLSLCTTRGKVDSVRANPGLRQRRAREPAQPADLIRMTPQHLSRLQIRDRNKPYTTPPVPRGKQVPARRDPRHANMPIARRLTALQLEALQPLLDLLPELDVRP